jgi:hypothetical protein
MHVAFAVGVLTKILEKIKQQKEAKDLEKRFELVGLSGTSAGALCARVRSRFEEGQLRIRGARLRARSDR